MKASNASVNSTFLDMVKKTISFWQILVDSGRFKFLKNSIEDVGGLENRLIRMRGGGGRAVRTYWLTEVSDVILPFFFLFYL